MESSTTPSWRARVNSSSLTNGKQLNSFRASSRATPKSRRSLNLSTSPAHPPSRYTTDRGARPGIGRLSRGWLPVRDLGRRQPEWHDPFRANPRPRWQAPQSLCRRKSSPACRSPHWLAVSGQLGVESPLGLQLGVLGCRHGCELCRIRSSFWPPAAPCRQGRCLPARLYRVWFRLAHRPVASGSSVPTKLLSARADAPAQFGDAALTRHDRAGRYTRRSHAAAALQI